MKTERTIGGKRCFLYEEPTARDILIQPIDGHDLELLDSEVGQLQERAPGIPFSLYAFLIEDWNRELSLWEAPAVFGRENFGDGAAQTLAFLQNSLIPEIRAGHAETGLRYHLGGYSLAGLFALWAASQTKLFTGAAAASPSVWFPGWTDFLAEHPLRASCVYLSLGDREEKARNPVMASVGDKIRLTENLIKTSGSYRDCVLEWNQGNHFKDSHLRTAKAFAWVLKKGKEI